MTFEKVKTSSITRFCVLFTSSPHVKVSSIRPQYGGLPFRYVVGLDGTPLATMPITNKGLWSLKYAPDKAFVNENGWIDGEI